MRVLASTVPDVRLVWCPHSGDNAGDIELSGWTRATEKDVRIAEHEVLMEEMREKVRHGYWDTSVECFLVQLEKNDAKEAAGLPDDTVTIQGDHYSDVSTSPTKIVFSWADEGALTFHQDGRVELGGFLTPEQTAAGVIEMIRDMWPRTVERRWEEHRADYNETRIQRPCCLSSGTKVTDVDGNKLTWNGYRHIMDKEQ